MNTWVIVLIAAFAFLLAVGFYRDWFGLWVSDEEMKVQIEQARQRMQGLGNQDLDRIGSPGGAMGDVRPIALANVTDPAAAEFEPVHGWTKPQLNDYLARNPHYKPAYEAALQKHQQA